MPEAVDMVLMWSLLVLTVALIVAGFAYNTLWWFAFLTLLVWVLGFAFQTKDTARWYRW